jgi:hypothetical protein
LADHLLDLLFEAAALMPIFQERSRQSEADLYALNRAGDLVIFDLKRSVAGADATLQIFRHAQDAGAWTFSTLEEKYRMFSAEASGSLADAHREAFGLERPLSPEQFNKRQQLLIVGSAANDELIDAVDYWKRQGLAIDFIPYRVYVIGGEHYFEFFSPPYDRHQNPLAVKGVIFDTNRTWDEDAIWRMMEKSRVAAYGDQTHVVDYLNRRDIVFFSHKLVGLVAAAEVLGDAKNDGPDERYREVKFLTPVPERNSGVQKYMPFGEVAAVTGKSFYWARTIKVPYLSREEAHELLDALRKKLA